MFAITRRQFLRVSAAAGAVTLAGCVTPTQPAAPVPEPVSGGAPSAPTVPPTVPPAAASRFGESPDLAALVGAGGSRPSRSACRTIRPSTRSRR